MQGDRSQPKPIQFEPRQPRYTATDLILNPATQQALDTVLAKVRHHEVLYERWNLKSIDPFGRRVVINLYGPPGTGKSMSVDAIAHALGKPLIQVDYAEIESKYVGDTPKNIVAAFQAAIQTDSVLFFDEADSILGKRLTRVTQSADHGVNVSRSTMLLQLDRFAGVVVFATNLARNYDPAFVRRILGHVAFELPTPATLLRLWTRMLPAEVPREQDVTIEWLADQTVGLAGGDLLQLVVTFCSRAVQRPPESQAVSREDVLASLGALQHAKRNVGSPFEHEMETAPRRSIVEVDRSELPPDAQERLNRLEHSDARGPADTVE